MVENQKREISEKDRLIVVLGPTASGKTKRAVGLAEKFDGEIISADSRQVYRQMNLGTGKDLEEYGNIPYHLIDICNPGEKYNLYDYIRDFHGALDTIRTNGRLPIVCGGSGMYLENALNGVRLPEVAENIELRKELESKSLEELTEILKSYKVLHNTTDIDTKKRAIRAIEIEEYYRQHPDLADLSKKEKVCRLNSLLIGIDIPREKRRERISERLHRRLDAGMVDEVRGLLKQGVAPEDLIYYGLEYKFLTLHVTGELSFEDMVRQLEIAIHQFSKRQMTWFRGMERRGFSIHWLPYDIEDQEFLSRVEELMNV